MDQTLYKRRSLIPTSLLIVGCTEGAVIVYGGGWHRREKFFLVKILLIQKLKSQANCFLSPVYTTVILGTACLNFGTRTHF